MKAHEMDWYRALQATRADEVKLDFAVALAAALEACGITRQEFAERVGVSGARVTKTLRGDANLTIESMDKLARAVGMDLHIHLAPAGSKVRWFDVLTSKANRLQTENMQNVFSTAQAAMSLVPQAMSDELIAQ